LPDERDEIGFRDADGIVTEEAGAGTRLGIARPIGSLASGEIVPVMVNDAGGAGRQIESLGEQSIHSDDAVPLEVDHGVMADIKIAKVLYADSVCIRSLDAGWGLSNDLHTATVPSGNVVKFCAISLKPRCRCAASMALSLSKWLMPLKSRYEGIKGMVVLNQQDLTVHLKSIHHVANSMMSNRINLPSWSFIAPPLTVQSSRLGHCTLGS